jgi:predicted phage-related endonuclease
MTIKEAEKELFQIGKLEKRIKKDTEELKERKMKIKDFMGDAEEKKVGVFDVFFKFVKSAVRVDTEKLKNTYPEVYEAVKIVGKEERRLTYKTDAQKLERRVK